MVTYTCIHVVVISSGILRYAFEVDHGSVLDLFQSGKEIIITGTLAQFTVFVTASSGTSV